MAFYTIDEPFITTYIESIDELLKYIKEDVYNYPNSSLTIFNDEESICISKEEIQDCLIMDWDDFCFKKYGVPIFLLNLQDERIKQDRANWEREKKERDEKLENLIKSRTSFLFDNN